MFMVAESTATYAETAAAESVVRLERSLTAKQLDRAIRRAGRRLDVSHRELAHHLHEMQETKQYKLFGFSELMAYARSRLELGGARIRQLLLAGSELPKLPNIDAAFCKGELKWSRVRELVRVATPATELEWLEVARTTSWDEFRRRILGVERGQRPGDRRKGLREQKTCLSVWLGALDRQVVTTSLERVAAASGEELSQAELIVALAKLALAVPAGTLQAAMGTGAAERGGEAAGEAAELDTKLFKVVIHSRDGETSVETAEGRRDVSPAAVSRVAGRACVIDIRDLHAAAGGTGRAGVHMPPGETDGETPPALRRRVLARDGVRCRSCGGRENLNAHHIVWRSRGGRTVPANLISMCGTCHALIHAGLIQVKGLAGGDRPGGGVTFLDAEGHPLDRPRPDESLVVEVDPQPAGSQGGDASVPDAQTCTAVHPHEADEPTKQGAGGTRPSPESVGGGVPEEIPAEASAQWWSRRKHLLRWNDRRGVVELLPGVPVGASALADAPAAGSSIPEHRPQSLDEVIGQEKACRALRVAAAAAASRGDAVGHVLLEGAPGLGKTSLALALAAEAGVAAHCVAAPLIRDPGALVCRLASLEEGSVLFVDEIHSLPRRVAEVLYEAMEDGRLSLLITDGATTRSVKLLLPRFTLVGATSAPEELPRPLLSRFTHRQHLMPYREAELAAIVRRAGRRDEVAVDEAAALAIAAASRSNARDGLQLYRACRDEAQSTGVSRVTAELVAATLAFQETDADGLRHEERLILQALRAAGGPVGLARLAATTGLDPDRILTVHEPMLLERRLVRVTPGGRTLA